MYPHQDPKIINLPVRRFMENNLTASYSSNEAAYVCIIVTSHGRHGVSNLQQLDDLFSSLSGSQQRKYQGSTLLAFYGRHSPVKRIHATVPSCGTTRHNPAHKYVTGSIFYVSFISSCKMEPHYNSTSHGPPLPIMSSKSDQYHAVVVWYNVMKDCVITRFYCDIFQSVWLM